MRSRTFLIGIGALVIAVLTVAMLATDLKAVSRPPALAGGGALLGRVKADKPWKVYVMPWGSGYARMVREGPSGFFLARPLTTGVYRVVIQLEPGSTDGDTAKPSQERNHTLAVPVALPPAVRMDAQPSEGVRASIQALIDKFREAYLAKDLDKMMTFYSDDYLSTRGENRKTKMDGLRRALESIEIRSLKINVDRCVGTDDHPFVIVAIDTEGVDPRNPSLPIRSKMATAMELVKDAGSGEWKIESSGAIPIPPFEERWVAQYVYLLNSPLAAVSVESGKVAKIPGVVDLRGP